jgi:hypothetical protein
LFMKVRSVQWIAVILIIAALGLYVLDRKESPAASLKEDTETEEDLEKEARFTDLRARYEWDMIKDPVTNGIPARIHERELAAARLIPLKGSTPLGASRNNALNTYYPAGPNNQGGRTRAFAYDLRFNGVSNRVMICGGVSGGIMRSNDGGLTWTRVSPDNEIHNVTCITQDPRPGNQDTWYAAGGEPFGNSASELSAIYLGFGLYKSTNNGVSWTRLTLSINGVPVPPAGFTLENFDHPFDFVHKIMVDPANGNIYIAGHRRLIRSTDGGSSFDVVFGGAVGAIAASGQMDIIKTGSRYILAVNGGNPDPSLRGVWTSGTGSTGSWTRIAGGSVLGTDSVANWRGNSFTFITGSTTISPKRIILAPAPSNVNIIYVCYENGLSNTAPDNSPEADMYKLDFTSGTNWNNLSANMPDFNGAVNHAATDPFAIQGGYDLMVTVKPDDPDFVLLGGTSLYRSTNGFSTTGGTSWIGGYGNTLPTLTFYPNSHPDIHAAVFHPTNFNEVICGNDGGLQRTTDITAAGSTVSWINIDNYQTLQYYYVALDPETGRNNFIGGAQDNGTQFRDKTGVIGLAPLDSNNHKRVFGGDGVAVGFSKVSGTDQYVYCGFQLGAIRRARIVSGLNSGNFTNITPTGLTGTGGEFGEFVTNFRLDPDNTEDLYYVNYNRLFRTNTASAVTTSTWTELTGVRQSVNPGNPGGGINIAIRALAFSRGPYATSHVLYIGTTNGKIFRLDDPRNIATATQPVDITPAGLPVGANVQDIATNPNNDDEVIAIVTNYLVGTSPVTNIWWTNNGKSATPTWRNAEGNLSLPSIRSCMIVVKKDASNNPVTEYYLGTSVGLYSAVDIGPPLISGTPPTWQREGGSVLNFAVIQSLSYRPADNVLLVGTHGNGIYYSFLGTPNFVPNQNTGTNDPPNNKNFIRTIFPTTGNGDIQYRIGNLNGIKKISIQLYTMSGELVLQKESNYEDGSINMARLSRGMYLLRIYSEDRKYRHLQKLIRQ